MIVNVETLKEQIIVAIDDDDALIERKIAAAQDHIERQLGFKIEEEYPADVPAALVEAVCQLVGHWYENREATAIGVSVQELPFSVAEIVREYRNWSW